MERAIKQNRSAHTKHKKKHVVQFCISHATFLLAEGHHDTTNILRQDIMLLLLPIEYYIQMGHSGEEIQ